MYFIHYSCYKHIGYVWRGLKTNPRPKESTARGPRPPVLKFLDPLLYFIWKMGKERVHNYSWNSNKSDIMSMLLMKWSIHMHRSSSIQKTCPQKRTKNSLNYTICHPLEIFIFGWNPPRRNPTKYVNNFFIQIIKSSRLRMRLYTVIKKSCIWHKFW